MGRDVGRDEGREQAEWRDLVARLELQAPVDLADAPWPDRENLRANVQPDTANPDTATPDTATAGGSSDQSPDPTGDTEHGDKEHGESDHGGAGRGLADRSRVIRPAGFIRPGEPAEPAADEPAAAGAGAAGTGESAVGGPRDYELDEPSDNDLDEGCDDKYFPPPLPPQPGLDPIAKGAWLALFGGPSYLLVATLLGWQIAGWAALTAVIAFVAGFVVLVVRLGDGPSKRDGPDQGAIV